MISLTDLGKVIESLLKRIPYSRFPCGSREEVNVSTVTGVWKKWIPSLREDSEGFKTTGKEVTAAVVGTAQEPEFEVEPEDVTELL